MAIPFSRSMRSLEQDRFVGAGWILVVGLVILAAWLVWFFTAEIRLYEVTEEARVEVAAASHPLAVQVSGRVIANHMSLDQAVEEGDLLLELEAAAEELQVVEQESKIDTKRGEMKRLLESIQSQKTALTSADEAGMSRAAEAEADFSRAEAVEQLATARLKRVEELVREEINSAQDLEQAESALRVAAANRRGASASIASKKSEWQTDMADRRAELEELERQYGVLEGEVSTSESTTRRLGLEVGKRSLMAPVSGRLGDLVDLPVGSVVTEGQVLGSVVPVSDELIVTAAFDPGQALGRIRPGQSARLRLVGYPWAEFGVVQATVSRVGSEVRDGKISVELSIEPDADSRIELGHGLPGTLEIQVEETSPSTLVLRSVGRLISRPVTATQ